MSLRDQAPAPAPDTLTGQGLYERARDPGGAPWDQLDARGKAIWRDAEQLISDRLAEIVGGSVPHPDTRECERQAPERGSLGEVLR